MLEDKQH